MVVDSSRNTFVYERDLSMGLDGKYRSVYDKIAAGSRVLEIGCSTGYFSEVLIRKNCEVIAVDNDFDAIRTCKKRGIEAHYCDVTSADFEGVLANMIGSMLFSQWTSWSTCQFPRYCFRTCQRPCDRRQS